MVIWVFDHYANAPYQPGPTRNYDFGCELVKKGHKVVIFASSFHNQLKKETKSYSNAYWQVENVNGVDFVWLKTFPYTENNWRRILDMVFYGLRAYMVARGMGSRRPDVIVGSWPEPIGALAAYLVSAYYKVPFVMEIRDLWPQAVVDLGMYDSRSLPVRIAYLIQDFLYRKAAKIIGVGERTGDYVSSRGVSSQKVVWLSNGVALSRFVGLESSPEPRKQKFTVGFLGTIGPVYGLESLVLAAQILQSRGIDDVEFLIAGEGIEKSRLEAICENNRNTNVYFLGPIPKEKAPDFLSSLDLCYISLEDWSVFNYGLSSNKVFEYMAAARPILAVSRALLELIKESNCGIVLESNRAEDIADAIIEFKSMPDSKRIEMGRNAFNYVSKFYSVEVLADKLAQTLSEVVEGANNF